MVVASLFGAYLSPIVAHVRRRLVSLFAVSVAGLAFVQALVLMARVARDGPVAYHLGGWAPPLGIEVLVTPASALLAVLLCGVATTVAVYAITGLAHDVAETAHGWYAAAYLLTLAGMTGLVISNDVFNIYVMMEVTTLGAVGLVVARNTWGAAEAGLRYLLLASLGSTLILMGTAMVFMITGNLNLGYLTTELAGAWQAYPQVAVTSLTLLTLGFALKAALFPLHVWLPEAHSNAPTTSSAVLSGLVVKVYMFTLIRLVYLIYRPLIEAGMPVREVLVWAAAAAIIGGSAFALVQVELKRLLAYGTVAQLGYIVLGVGLGTPAGMVAAFYQIVSHAITKTCLFLCAGVIITQTGRHKLSEMGGLGKALPVTTAAFALSALSMVGLPLLSGFVVKWYLIQAGLEAQRPAFMLLVVVSGLLNAAYYLPVVWRFYFQPSPVPLPERRPLVDPAAWPPPTLWERAAAKLEAPATMLAPLVILATACVVLGTWTTPLVQYLNGVAATFLGTAVGP